MLCIQQYRKEALNMKLIADLHSHTLMSGHAFGTIREMAQAAADNPSIWFVPVYGQ